MNRKKITADEIIQQAEGDGMLLYQTDHNEIRLRISEFKGIMRLDIRRYFFAGEDGRTIPTRAGIALRLETLPLLIQALIAISTRESNA